MADDDLDDDFVPEDIEGDLDEDALEEEDLDEEAVVADDALVVADDDDDDEIEETAEVIAARAKKKRDEDDDDDDEADPDDVEADLDTILKDRIAAADEEEDDDLEEEAAPRPAPDAPDGVVPKRANEFTCTGCFLLVNRGQFGPEHDMRCPVGEADCPAIAVLAEPARPVTSLAKAARKAPAKAARKAPAKGAKRR